jgi:hypothetical protein
VFLRKKEERRSYHGWYRDKAYPSFRRDRNKGGCCDLHFLKQDHNRGPYGTTTVGSGNSYSSGGTSSSGGTVTEGPYGTGTSSSSGGTAAVSGYNNETSSSTACMHFVLGTSSSSYIMCVTNWSARPIHRGGGGLILQTWPWLGFRRGAGGQV